MQAITKGGQTVMLVRFGWDGFCGVRVVYQLKPFGRGLRQREYILDGRCTNASLDEQERLCQWLAQKILTLSLLGVVHLTENKVAAETGIHIYVPHRMPQWQRNVAETA